MGLIDRLRSDVREAWGASWPLMATVALMLPSLGVALLGLLVDTRVIAGAPAWLKPAKFAVSTIIYAGSLAWLLRYLTVWPRLTRVAAWTTAIALVVEIALIDLQAARGTTSHFNQATGFDIAVFSIMGGMILLLWIASVVLAAALFRQTFANPAWGWALRMGLVVTVLGSAMGGLMLPPRAEQALTGPRPSGGHTVGAPDGTPGLPLVNWSRTHGDLRIPHFFGLHGLQAIPILALALSRRRRVRRSMVAAVTASYISLIAILVAQALSGQSIANPDRTMVLALVLWAATSAALVVSLRMFDNGNAHAPRSPKSSHGRSTAVAGTGVR
jgi:hypothetical protein